MMNLSGKRVGELTTDDLNRLCDERWPEDANLEFKANLPAKDGGLDSWHKSSDKIGDYARNEIVREVIAFANAHGGTLFIGVEETDTKPAQAKAVAPLPNCGDLAERLQMQCRDMIEPQIPLIEIAGVLTSDDGAGVIAIRVPQSRLGPHRHKATKECHVRRGNRTEAMTMREIQDLTLQVERGIRAVEARFEERRVVSKNAFDSFFSDGVGYHIRVTALPLVPLQVRPVYKNDAVKPPLLTYKIKIDGQSTHDAVMSRQTGLAVNRPILRGSRQTFGDSNRWFAQEVHSDGLIEYTVTIRRTQPKDNEWQFRIWPSVVLATVANCMCAANRFRRTAGAPEVEYGLEIEISTNVGQLGIAHYGNRPDWETAGTFPIGKTFFPKYSIGPKSELPALMNEIEQDFWHAAEQDYVHSFDIEFPQNT